MNFGSLGSFEFLWQCLSSLEIFDRNAKASWSNFKVDRNPEFRSLKQGYKKRNISSRGSLNWHYPSILYLLWMRRKCHSLRRDLPENWDFFIKFNMLWNKSPTKKQKEYERLFTFGMILLSFRFFGKKPQYFQSRCFCTFWAVAIQSGPFYLHMRHDQVLLWEPSCQKLSSGSVPKYPNTDIFDPHQK